ncbi:MAG: hypothetical protein V1838_02035 [Patescibacteria group bacterium]
MTVAKRKTVDFMSIFVLSVLICFFAIMLLPYFMVSYGYIVPPEIPINYGTLVLVFLISIPLIALLIWFITKLICSLVNYLTYVTNK